jgi:hypothetical protein
VWRAALIFILLLVSVVMNKVYIFQTHDSFKDIRLGNISEMLIYGLLFAVVFSVKDPPLRCSTGPCTTFSTSSAINTT